MLNIEKHNHLSIYSFQITYYITSSSSSLDTGIIDSNVVSDPESEILSLSI